MHGPGWRSHGTTWPSLEQLARRLQDCVRVNKTKIAQNVLCKSRRAKTLLLHSAGANLVRNAERRGHLFDADHQFFGFLALLLNCRAQTAEALESLQGTAGLLLLLKLFFALSQLAAEGVPDEP